MAGGIAEVLDVKSVMKMEADFALTRKGKIMFKVPNGQDPYSVIGKYIRDHITAIEDIIAVIKINDVETNQLFVVNIKEENYFIWKNDWWEGEEDVTLIDFFPVSEVQRTSQSVQSADIISRQDALDAIGKCTDIYVNNLPTMVDKEEAYKALNEVPSVEQIVRCKDCKYCGGLSGFYCDIVEKAVGADSFCSWAERRTDEDD